MLRQFYCWQMVESSSFCLRNTPSTFSFLGSVGINLITTHLMSGPGVHDANMACRSQFLIVMSYGTGSLIFITRWDKLANRGIDSRWSTPFWLKAQICPPFQDTDYPCARGTMPDIARHKTNESRTHTYTHSNTEDNTVLHLSHNRLGETCRPLNFRTRLFDLNSMSAGISQLSTSEYGQ